MRDLNELKLLLTDKATDDLADALLTLKLLLKPHTEYYNEIIGVMERRNRLQKALHKGLISYQDADIIFNQLFNAAISNILDLKEEDLK